MLHLARGIAAG